MIVNVTTQSFTAGEIAAAAQADAVTLHDATYGLTIARAEGGFLVTDETGGDQVAADLDAAFAMAVEFLRHIDADEDADWARVVEVLAQ